MWFKAFEIVIMHVKLTKIAIKYDELNIAKHDLSVTFNKHSAFLILNLTNINHVNLKKIVINRNG